MPVWLFLTLFFGVGAVLPPWLHHQAHGGFSWTYFILSFFLVINLLICFWEICLFLRIDHIKARNATIAQDTPAGRLQPSIDFFNMKVTPGNVFSPTLWSEVWTSYSVYDGSYADRRTFGFGADVGNGFVTLIPTLTLHAGMTWQIMDARYLGILMLIVFYQMLYMTSMYWASFFINRRQQRLQRHEMLGFIWGTNCPWAIVPAYGLYVAVTLILTDNYAILGF